MLRIALFIATNIAILVVISIVFQLLGLEGVLAANGTDLNLQALLVMSAVIGFSGSLISLLLSKFMAKRSTGCQRIEDSRDPQAQWIVSRVRAHAEAAGIGMPEVAVFPADGPNAFATGRNPKNASIALTTGLLDQLERHLVRDLRTRLRLAVQHPGKRRGIFKFPRLTGAE